MSERREQFVREAAGGAAGAARPSVRRARALDLDELADGVCSGKRASLARALSLVESSNARHRATAESLVARLMPRTGGSVRVGVTGPPGAGKSTFIEALGTTLTGRGRRVAVLAIDPSSGVTGGSILGDKTRMGVLSSDPLAFVRPSPTRGTLGGVTRRTREAILLCEATGFDVTLVETAGVGQNETAVAELTDAVLAIVIPGAGDELQGVKRGLLEVVDVVAVNKADGAMVPAARRAAAEHAAALRCAARPDGWEPIVRVCSSLTREGVEAVWDAVLERFEALRGSGELTERRRGQVVRSVEELAEAMVLETMWSDERVRSERATMERAVVRGETTPAEAARAIVRAFGCGETHEQQEATA